MTPPEKLMEIVDRLPSPKFRNPKMKAKLMIEILDIHNSILTKKKVDRKARRKIKRLWEYGLPYNLYDQLDLPSALKARHIKMICEEK